MSQQHIDQFLTLSFVKKMLKSTDDQDDDSYLQFVNNSNTKVISSISRYITVPIGGGSKYFSRCHNAALAYFRALNAEDIELLEKSEKYLKKFNIELYGEGGTEKAPMAGGLIQELIGDRADTKSEPVLTVFDPREKKVILPSQLDLATTEEFT